MWGDSKTEMQDVPKIVIKRLQGTAPVGTHPDADVLTAFAEKSLAEAERARVVEHLARCSDCREVVALVGLPATEVAAVKVFVTPTRASWFSWPVLRWCAAAGIVAIVLVGIVQYRQRARNKILVSSLTSGNETNATVESVPSPSASAAPAVPEMKEALSSTEKRRQE